MGENKQKLASLSFHSIMLLDFLTTIVFPPVCVACQRGIARGVICEPCLATITLNDTLICGECHAPIAASAFGLPPSATCHPEFPFVLGSAGKYNNDALKLLIHNLKFRSMQGAAMPLGELLRKYVEFLDIDLTDYKIIPIPLSRRRKNSRGYNQAELIARYLADALQLPIDVTSLVRIKNIKPQSKAESEAERRENIRGVFAIKNPDLINGKNILLIDDVATTGATFLEATFALKSAGTKTIIALAAAKT